MANGILLLSAVLLLLCGLALWRYNEAIASFLLNDKERRLL